MRNPGNATRSRRHVVIRGVVQGVGFRPFVYALARSLELSGSVCNTGEGVLAEVEGAVADVASFVRAGADRRAAPGPGARGRVHRLPR